MVSGRRRRVPCLVCGVVVFTDGSHCELHRPVDRRPSRMERGRRSRSKWVERVRPRALRRARFRCEVVGCGVVGGALLEVHHVVSVELGGSDLLSNLRVLCVVHHLGVHRGGVFSYR